MKLEKPRKLQNVFKSNLKESLKGRFKSEEQQSALKILNCFTDHEKLLTYCLLTILQFYLKSNTKQNMENVSKS